MHNCKNNWDLSSCRSDSSVVRCGLQAACTLRRTLSNLTMAKWAYQLLHRPFSLRLNSLTIALIRTLSNVWWRIAKCPVAHLGGHFLFNEMVVGSRDNNVHFWEKNHELHRNPTSHGTKLYPEFSICKISIKFSYFSSSNEIHIVNNLKPLIHTQNNKDMAQFYSRTKDLSTTEDL